MKKNHLFSTGMVISLLVAVSIISCNAAPKKSGDGKSFYQEKYRPQFHFSPEAHWMNDPNGMVFYAGEYHLFYQYYPESSVWGPMHWGHAVSTDLVHWKHLPIALYPDSLGMIFSGSAVIDWNNTTGFGSKGNPPMVAIYTHHNGTIEKAGGVDVESEAIAFSLDKGRTWAKYKNNPVIKNPGIRDFRDPKVSWNKEAKKWIMVLAAHDRVKYYSSPNLKDWSFESDFGMGLGAHGGVWECPDLFPVKVEGSGETKWVQMVSINPGGPNGGSATQYFVGNFNGKTFASESTRTNWIDWGRDDYAGVTWSDVPEKDGRRLFLGWMSNWQYGEAVPTSVWRSAMTFPRELVLKKVSGGYLLASSPARELALVRDQQLTTTVSPETISGEKEVNLNGVALSQCELNFDFSVEKGIPDSFGLVFENGLKESLKIEYSKGSAQFIVDRANSGSMSFSNEFAGLTKAPYILKKEVRLHILADAASVEIFVDDGNLVMTDLVFPTESFNKLKVFSSGGKIELKNAEIVGLKRIW